MYLNEKEWSFTGICDEWGVFQGECYSQGANNIQKLVNAKYISHDKKVLPGNRNHFFVSMHFQAVARITMGKLENIT